MSFLNKTSTYHEDHMTDAMIITNIGGNCPVQAEGTLDGKPFYFRARGQHWTFGVGEDPVINPDWVVCIPYGSQEFAAGWMTVGEARVFIDKAVASYRAFIAAS